MTREFQINSGENFNFDLEGNMTTGYDWSYTSDNPEVVKITKEIQDKSPTTIGSGNLVRFIITGLIPGKVNIAFSYHRPWEPGVIANRVEIMVEVH